MRTAIDGDIPTLPSPAVNPSYQSAFFGLSLKCESPPVEVLEGFSTDELASSDESGADITHFNNQAMMESLGRLLVGTVSSGTSTGAVAGYGFDDTAPSLATFRTQVLQTRLAFTKESVFLIYNGSCKTQDGGSPGCDITEEVPPLPPLAQYGLGDTIEQLFELPSRFSAKRRSQRKQSQTLV